MPSDMTRLRALAHPTRTRIVSLLRERSSMTATECAGILRLSPKTCSYHLQTLAASGLVEEVPTRGRNRPWRLSDRHQDQAPNGPAVPEPADQRRTVLRRRETSLLADAAEAIGDAPPDWAADATVHTRLASFSPAELRAWYEDVERITSRHVRRAAQPTLHPPADRLPVRLLFYGYPDGTRP